MAVQYKDYYQVLGVAKGVPQEEIRKAFRKLAREYHPDVAKDKTAAAAKFREINEAYEILGDPEKRQKYDELGAQWQGRGRGGGGQMPREWGQAGAPNEADFDSFNEFFEAFMGAGRSGPGAKRTRGAHGGMARPRDVEAEVEVSVEEALHGAKKRVSVRLPGSMAAEHVDVNVPAAMVPGHKIRQPGKGLSGGDLVFKVILRPHATYGVEGSDLVKTVQVPAWKAVLGGTLEVATPDGMVRLKVNSGTQPGRRFRLPGRGLPMAGKRRGDFYVLVQVTMPEALTLEQRACWVKLQELDQT